MPWRRAVAMKNRIQKTEFRIQNNRIQEMEETDVFIIGRLSFDEAESDLPILNSVFCLLVSLSV